MQIQYNSYTITDDMLYGKFDFHIDYTKVRIACNIIVTEADSSTLVSVCSAMEAAFRIRYKDLVFTFGSTSEYSLSHSSNTYLLAEPSLTKVTSEMCTETARTYRLEINAQLPADQTGYNYRREASYSINYETNRRKTVHFSMMYTAGGANSSYVNYTTYGKAWAAGILTGLGGNYELVDEKIDNEQELKITNASFSYRQVLDDETSTTFNIADVARVSLTCALDLNQMLNRSVTNYPLTDSLSTMRISYSAIVNSEVVTDPANIETTYRTKIKNWIIEHAAEVLGMQNYSQINSNSLVIQKDEFTINPSEYTVQGTIILMLPKSLNATIMFTEVLNTEVNYNVVYQKLWDGVDHTYNIYSTGAKKIITRDIMVSKLGSQPIRPIPLVSKNMVILNSSDSLKSYKQGISSTTETTSVIVFTSTFRETYLYVVPKSELKLPPQRIITPGGF